MVKPDPKITIIIPCYNQAEFLADCINSVIAQTFKQWECIIVNDGSLDDTEKIAVSFAHTDDRFKYHNQPNQGLSAARNKGIDLANGTFILPLDADDKIGERYIEMAIKEFESAPNTKLVYCKALFFGERNGEWDIIQYSFKELLLRNIIFCSAIFRKTDALAIGGYDNSFINGWEDWDMWIRLLDTKSEVKKLDYKGFYYRIKSKSMLQTLELSSEIKNKIRREVMAKNIDKYCEVFGQPYQLLANLMHGTEFIAKVKNTIPYKIWAFYLFLANK